MAEPEPLTRQQKQTLPARQTLARTFASPGEKSAHFRALAHRSHERRITLSGDEAVALLQAYALLCPLAERARAKVESPPREAATRADDVESSPRAGASSAEVS